MRHPVLAVLLGCTTLPAAADTFTVTTNADSGPGTLRQAMLDANVHVGADTIAFSIPDGGVHTIAPLTYLPAITDALTIDGYTQPGSQPNTNTPAQGGLNGVLTIELSGENLPPTQSVAFVPVHVDFTVRGLVINRHQWAVRPSDPASGQPQHELLVEGCYLGTNPAGSSVPGTHQGTGIESIDPTYVHVVIGGNAAARNLISGFTDTVGGFGRAIQLQASRGGPIIVGNLIGTDASGTLALSNGSGIGLARTGSASVGSGARIADNVISGNTSYGLFMACGFGGDPTCIDGLTITGNVIGARRDGAAPLPNGSFGVRISTGTASAAHVLIGGSMPQDENVIAWNGERGLTIPNNSQGIIELARNRIFNNTSLDIDLPNPENGRNNNDSHDSDGSGLVNRLQNFPVIVSVAPLGNQLTVRYRVPTATAYATYPLTVRFYRTAASGGDRWLADDTYDAVDAELEKQIVLTLPAGVTASGLIATAADAAGNTSEFSDPLVFGNPDLIFADGFE